MKKFKIPKQIILLFVLVLILSVVRIVLFDSYSLVYILWNIFLAFIPFVISFFLLLKSREKRLPKIWLIIGGIFWLLFFPNAPYLVTDLIHIGVVHTVPAVYDSFLLFSSAWVGLLLGFYSLFHIEQVIRIKYPYRKTKIIIAVVILFSSFGVYIGRFLRFNSWDIFINHSSVRKSIWSILSESAIYIEVYLYTALFFIFIYLSYYAWRSNQVK